MSYLIASISNSGGAPEQAYRKMQAAGACPSRPFAEMFKLEVPSLSVGTLDSLMNLSDELGKSDTIVEAIVRKIDRAAVDLIDRKAVATSAHHGAADLTVGGVPPQRYIQQFAWDSAKFPSRRPLKELVALIASSAASIEEELKQLSGSYGEKVTSLQEAKRKKGGNLVSGDLNEILTEAMMSKVKVVDTEYLKTVFIAIPKANQAVFEQTVYKLGEDIVGFGGPDWSCDPAQLGAPVSYGETIDRFKRKGSPVVPGSCQKIHADEDSILYAVTILKSQYKSGFYENGEFHTGTTVDFIERFEKTLKEKRYFLREFTYDPTASTKNAILLETLQVEVDSMKMALLRWCKTHYGDAYVAWIHLKVIRVFVESVLRYGLPVDFTAVLYKVHQGKDVDLMKALDKELGIPVTSTLDDNKKGDNNAADDEDFHDFVLIKFDP